MNALYEKYKKLEIDGNWIGLGLGMGAPCFCTSVGAEIIGRDNGAHYCFIKGFGDTVFCVHPENCCDWFVYPIARNFRDYLGLILAVGSTNTLRQIIWWDKKTFDEFVHSPGERKYKDCLETKCILNTIQKEMGRCIHRRSV